MKFQPRAVGMYFAGVLLVIGASSAAVVFVACWYLFDGARSLHFDLGSPEANFMLALLLGFFAVLTVIWLIGVRLVSESKHVSDVWPPSILR